MTNLHALARVLLRYGSGRKRPAEDSPDDEPEPIRRRGLDQCDPPPEDGVVTDMFANEATADDVVYIEKGGTADDFACFARLSLQQLYMNALLNLEWKGSIDAFLARAVDVPVVTAPMKVPGLSRPFTSDEEERIFPGLSGPFFTSAGRLSSSAKDAIADSTHLRALLDEQYRTKGLGDTRRRELEDLPPIDVFVNYVEQGRTEDAVDAMDAALELRAALTANDVDFLTDVLERLSDSYAHTKVKVSAIYELLKPHAYSERTKTALVDFVRRNFRYCYRHGVGVPAVILSSAPYASHLSADESRSVQQFELGFDPVIRAAKSSSADLKQNVFKTSPLSILMSRYDVTFVLPDDQSLTFEFEHGVGLRTLPYVSPPEAYTLAESQSSVLRELSAILSSKTLEFDLVAADGGYYASFKHPNIRTDYHDGVVHYRVMAS